MPLHNEAHYKIYLESLLNTLSDVVIFLSPEGIINEVTPLMETYFSWKLDRIKGKSFESLFQMAQHATPFSLEDYNNMRHNGVKIDTLTCVDNKKIHLSWAYVPINPFSGSMLIGRDVSEIKKLDIRHRTLNSQLEKISACVPAPAKKIYIFQRILVCQLPPTSHLGPNFSVCVPRLPSNSSKIAGFLGWSTSVHKFELCTNWC